ncbi:LRR 8 domain containing protein [Asbolus verrucosus]|uniref:LRR 8 domain containing protein n=1 Tax=Asbolus verrucosus TaxID=1661398 RepID=A0A482W8H7_ASBVE|nr:LRR 8 domain containing protein [Asbolus verrucosus]
MCFLWFCFIFVSLVDTRFVFCECEKSFVIICDNVPDVGFNKTKRTWTELLIQPNKYENIPPQYTLSTRQLSRDLSNLKWLFVVKQLTAIEKNAFSYVKNLQNLVLFDNNLGVVKSSTFVGFRSVAKLGLENNNIEYMEERAFISSKIEIVDLSHNKLSVLRSELFRKCQVVQLIITDNKLSKMQRNSVPTSLKVLRLDRNEFDYIPDELNYLKQLEEFTISHNSLFYIVDFSELQRLKKLDLSFNKISSVGNEFEKLRSLRYLNLNSNDLKRFVFSPSMVKNMGEQFSIFLGYNRLRNLNLEAINDTKVTIILSGNPWNCKCLLRMESIIHNNTIIRTICDQRHFDGKLPICVATDLKECLEDEVPEKEFKKFRSFCNLDATCNLFTDIDTSVY